MTAIHKYFMIKDKPKSVDELYHDTRFGKDRFGKQLTLEEFKQQLAKMIPKEAMFPVDWKEIHKPVGLDNDSFKCGFEVACNMIKQKLGKGGLNDK